jgi:hypothetical protein
MEDHPNAARLKSVDDDADFSEFLELVADDV